MRVRANGLEHHVIEWPGPAERTVVLLHGYLDLARSFEGLGDALAARGYRVLAPDFRGHGDTAWAPEGSYYHFFDYVSDLALLLDALAPVERAGPLAVFAHSMGGTVATLFAGAFPSRVRALALAEGIGPPGSPAQVVPDRVARWIAGLAKLAGPREARRIASLEDAVARLRGTHGGAVPDAVLARVAAFSTRVHPSGEGRAWRFDPLHQTTSPSRFDAEAFAEFAARVTAPVLLLDGGDTGHILPDTAGREALYARREKVSLAEAGHMMHWTRPDALARAVVDFFARHAP